MIANKQEFSFSLEFSIAEYSVETNRVEDLRSIAGSFALNVLDCVVESCYLGILLVS